MHQQCVIDVDVTVREGALEPSGARTTASALEIALEHLREVWAQRCSGVPSAADLAADGFTVLPLLDDPTEWHDLRWSSVRAHDGALVGVRADHHTSLRDRGGVLTRTRTTLTTDPGATSSGAHVRVATGVELVGGLLVPVDEPDPVSPALLALLVRDPRLRVVCAGQDVDARLPALRTPEEGDALLAALHEERRLPLLLVDPAEQAAWGLARRAATELLGLARVVVVRGAACERVAEAAPDLAPPPGGVRLVWPALSAEHRAWSAEEALAADPPLVGQVFGLLASLSVLASRRDDGWLQARRRTAEVHRAAVSQDGEVAALRAEVEEWSAEVELQLAANEELRLQLRDLDALRFEVDRWRARAAALEAEASADHVRWDDAPALDPRDAAPLFAFLEEASGGALCFTDRAARAWHRCGYIYPDKMREALVSLAQAAREFAQRHGQVEGRMKAWFAAGYHLDVALTDSVELTRRAGFTFEGEELAAVPHVKLGDNTHPDACGRVYFAWTSQPPRFVVDHVGQHR